MNEDDAIRSVQGKIEREKALINAANAMRQSTNNPAVLSRLDGQIREGRRNIEYLEGRARELQMRRVGTDIENLSLGSGSNGPPSPEQRRNPLPPPPKDTPGEYADGGSYGQSPPGGYSQLSGGQVLMPPKAPYAAPGPGQPRQRANYSKLDLIKYDTPHLGPRIQLMLSQLEFKLSVEKQYKDGIEKMVRLYQMEGDRKSKADAEARRIESNQKIQLLKQALKRYEDLHVDIEGGDGPDDDSLNVPSARKPLTGHLTLRIHQVADVDHAATGRFSRGPETFVIMKVEDAFKGRTKATRNDKWTDEVHEFSIDNANEVELTVYDRTGDHPLPIGMLWVRISDIAEEMRRKRIETELNSSSAMWVSADKMGAGGGAQPDMQFQPPPQAATGPGGTGAGAGQGLGGGPQPQTGPIYIDAWFALEPVGRIQLTLSFAKENKDRRPFDVGLGRKGAIRQRKEEIHEQYGHKFVQQQFYNIMRCALCGDFLKYAAGMQCSDCKYTCHKKCYQKVVTKCITQSNAETDPDEAKLNHRIPHRFEPFANMGANWCCHCGYVLPFGKKQCRKCSECGSTCHAQCVHFVPDFCGMSMEVANQILAEISTTKKRQTSSISMSSRTLRPSSGSGRPSGPSASGSYASNTDSVQSERLSYGKDSYHAAQSSYAQSPSSPTQQRPPTAPRTQSTDAAKAAVTALSQAPGHHQRSSTDYQPSSPSRSSGGYPQQGSPEAQSPQQPSYNPADYAGVLSYPIPPLSQPPQQPPPQHPPRQSSYPQPAPPPTTPLPPHPQQAAQPPAPPHNPIAVQPPNQKKELPPHNYQGTGRRIGLDHFNFLAVLGKGNFGKVMLAETKSNKQLYAIKVLKKEFIIENDEVESTRSEKRVFLIANKERHPFLLNLHACFQTETRVYFVMEYVSGGDLMLHIQRGQFGTKRAQFYAAEVCLALKYFHENGVIYRDLKLDNILLTLDGHIKIADYGLCKEDMWYGSTTSTFCGTPEFMAPEILLDKKYGRAVDWWAFGVLIYQMLLQQSPFRGEDEDEIYDAILADEPLYPIHMPRDSVSILQKLLTREPELRLGSGPTDAQEIMSHAFFRNINWEDVYHKRIPAPFIPTISSATDTSNFDQEFTSVTPVLTPVQSVLSQAMQEEFRGFSYSADFV
ncbi:C2 calcium-dependent membrane targeting [Lasiodiplodia theobromae]|uniref:protein kinase C n=1 Tax=Lasiodiplodia theobromae TaxID=45133 RepID=A0A5N5DD78_9PEZI|nr:C2 calcium-dependent membrane targeting protein [Lasiodiplodia theobromae]KAB2575024.1 Protein kinase C-like [Lasiodiplodia theobromae]KAF4534227.1 C2 calcium-dependent membrane targeting protein [Lasiodiplodia theobromae]KAF9640209.1 C2 calcium-dependent membrane targeting [Lasiodiplodia theobromae]